MMTSFEIHILKLAQAEQEMCEFEQVQTVAASLSLSRPVLRQSVFIFAISRRVVFCSKTSPRNVSMRYTTMPTTEVYRAVGCLKHNRLYHKERKEWVPFTLMQMDSVRKVYAYCKLEFTVQAVCCDECGKEDAHS